MISLSDVAGRRSIDDMLGPPDDHRYARKKSPVTRKRCLLTQACFSQTGGDPEMMRGLGALRGLAGAGGEIAGEELSKIECEKQEQMAANFHSTTLQHKQQQPPRRQLGWRRQWQRGRAELREGGGRSVGVGRLVGVGRTGCACLRYICRTERAREKSLVTLKETY